MQHKTFRDLTKYEKEMNSKFRELVQQISQLTLEEVIYLLQNIQRMIWLSMQTVDEKYEPLKKAEDEQESL